MNKEEWFDLPKLQKFDKDFKNKKFDEEMALGLLNEVQKNWCSYCDNYRENACGCYLPDFKKEMIKKIKEHFNYRPYKFEDLKVGIFVYDSKNDRINKIIENFDADCGIPYIKIDDGFGEWLILEFEENRFFPV